MGAPVEVLYETNLRDPAAQLRKIADSIDADKYGDVTTLAVVLMGREMEVFGGGTDYSAPTVALLLHSGFLRMSQAVESAGEA